MEFSKEFLQGILWGDTENVEVMQDEISGQRRWSTDHEMVFKFDGKYYETYYSRGSTECQDEVPYEYDEDMIECPEVFPVEKTIIVYEEKK